MYIIRIKGGLGNQMFQYVFYKCIQQFHPNEIIKVDISFLELNPSHNGFEIEEVFNFSSPPLKATKKEIQKYSDEKRLLPNRIRRKLFGNKKSHYIEKELIFDKSVFDLSSPILFDGYWISWKYCELLSFPLHNLFQFNDFHLNDNIVLEKHIKNSLSVGVHIRRGDYLLPPFSKIYTNICTITYYKNAIAYLEKELRNPTFFIFSDEPDWIKSNLSINNSIVISHNSNENSYKDMQLMSLCKHNIIANSTFSWWGAYLNKNPDKIVISPNKWINSDFVKYNFEDIIPSSWITQF
jgi:hypothetical protein